MQFLEAVALCLGSALFTYSLVRFADMLGESTPQAGRKMLIIFGFMNLGWLLFLLVGVV